MRLFLSWARLMTGGENTFVGIITCEYLVAWRRYSRGLCRIVPAKLSQSKRLHLPKGGSEVVSLLEPCIHFSRTKSPVVQ